MGLETEMEKQIILVGSYTNFKILYLTVPPSSLKGHLKDSHFLREHTPCQRRWGLCLSKSIRGSFWKNSSPSLLGKNLSWRIAFMRLDQGTFSRPLGHVPTLARCWSAGVSAVKKVYVLINHVSVCVTRLPLTWWATDFPTQSLCSLYDWRPGVQRLCLFFLLPSGSSRSHAGPQDTSAYWLNGGTT